MNQTVKTLIGKLPRETGLPVSVWPALLPGAAQQLNSCVHSGTGESAYKRAGHPRGGKAIGLTAGDVVSVVEPRSKVAYEGWFGGYATDKVANVVCKVGTNHWRVLRVHPSVVKAVPGRAVPYGGGNPLKAELRPNDIVKSDNEDYDMVDGREEVVEVSVDAEAEPTCIPDIGCRPNEGPIDVGVVEEGEHIRQVDFKMGPKNLSPNNMNEDDDIEIIIP